MHRHRPFLLAATLATFAAPLWAGATVEILSQTPAGIYLDGEYLGPAPMTLNGLAPGSYTVEAAMAEGRRSFLVVSPSMADSHRVLDLDAGGLVAPAPAPQVAPAPAVQTVVYQPAPVVVPAPAPVVYRPAPVYQPAPVVYRPAPVRTVVYAPPAPVCTTPQVFSPAPVVRRDNTHVRVRNTLLGLGAAAFLFKKLDDRHDRRHQPTWSQPAPAPGPVAQAPRRVGPPGGGIPGGRGSNGRGAGRGPI